MNKNSNNFKTAEPESFRDSINIISKEGKRNFVYPKEPKGKFYKLRTWFSILLIAFLIGIPFIKVSGHPLMLFNIIERKFIMFGFGFGPHDFYLFVIAMI